MPVTFLANATLLSDLSITEAVALALVIALAPGIAAMLQRPLVPDPDGALPYFGM